MKPEDILLLIVGLALGVLGNYIFEGFGFKQRAAKTSQRRAARRIEALTEEYEEVRTYHADRQALISLVVGRLLLVNLLWIGQEAVDYLLGLVSNGTYAVEVFSPYVILAGEQVASGASVLASGVGAILLLTILNIGVRTYRTWRRVQAFQTYELHVHGQIADLKPKADSAP
jgi:hypothetical protein